ncbi:MAG: hypothetical protein H6Q73_1807 [Firmicutes bacterium]|nr:hypothetical protein [Bacillota bacterium]
MDWSQDLEGKKCISTGALCEILGVTKQSLNYWEQQGCPKVAHGWWCIAEVLRWRGLVGPGVRTEGEAYELTHKEQKTKAEADLKKIQAATAALRLSEIKGKFITVEEVNETLTDFFAVLKKSLLSLNRKISQEVMPFVGPAVARTVERVVMEIVNDALKQISTDGQYTPPRKRKTKH